MCQDAKEFACGFVWTLESVGDRCIKNGLGFLFIFKGYCSLLSVAMMNTMTKKKVYFILHVQVIIQHWGKLGQGLRNRRRTLFIGFLPGSQGYFSYIMKALLPRYGTAHCGLGFPTLINNQENHTDKPEDQWWRQCFLPLRLFLRRSVMWTRSAISGATLLSALPLPRRDCCVVCMLSRAAHV